MGSAGRHLAGPGKWPKRGWVGTTLTLEWIVGTCETLDYRDEVVVGDTWHWIYSICDIRGKLHCTTYLTHFSFFASYIIIASKVCEHASSDWLVSLAVVYNHLQGTQHGIKLVCPHSE